MVAKNSLAVELFLFDLTAAIKKGHFQPFFLLLPILAAIKMLVSLTLPTGF
jgi:hypothetical protein